MADERPHRDRRRVREQPVLAERVEPTSSQERAHAVAVPAAATRYAVSSGAAGSSAASGSASGADLGLGGLASVSAAGSASTSGAGASSSTSVSATGSVSTSGAGAASSAASTASSSSRLGRRRPPRFLLGALLRLHRRELLVARQLAALGDDERAHVDAHVLEELDRNRVAADPLDRVDLDLAPVDADLAASASSSSAMFVGVTEPNSEPVGPAFTSKRSSRLLEDLRDLLRLLDRARLVARALLVALAQLRDLRRRRRLGEPPRQQEVARIAARDVHDLAAQAERCRRRRGG